MRQNPAQPINLQSNYPVLPEQEAAWPALLQSGVERFAADSLRLPPFGGSASNRELAAAWLGLSPDRTFLCTSGHHGTMAALLAAGLAGKTIAVEALTYPWFIRQAQMLGCSIVPIAIDAEGLLPEALRFACANTTAPSPISAIYTMPTMHNPTCAVASLGRRQQIVAVARDFNLTILEDAAYGFLVEHEPPRYTALAPELAFYIESLSKRVVPGLRTCFLAAPAALAEQTALALRVMTSGSSTLLASIGCAMAADGSLASTIAAKRTAGAARSAAALELLHGLHVQSAPNAWHLWVTLPSGLTAEAAETLCEQRGVLVTGGHWFTAPSSLPHTDPNPLAPAVRLGLGGEVETTRALEGVSIFASILREHAPH